MSRTISFWSDWKAYALYGLTTLLVCAPLLTPGFIMTLDFVFTPELPMPQDISSSYLFRAFLHLLNVVVPGDVIQKIIMLAIFLASSIGMHRLIRTVTGAAATAGPGIYIASIFFAINPFTYSRFMAGHYSVLLGYALLPWLMTLLIAFGRQPNIKNAVKLSLLTVLIAILSIHTLASVALLAAGVISVALWQRRTYLKTYARYGLIIMALFVTLSSYWLVPLALGKGTTADTIQSFTVADTKAFATTGDNPIERTFHVLRLQGFWAERRGLFLLPQDRSLLWGLMAMIIIALVIVGAVSGWRRHRAITAALLISAGLALLIAIGLAGEAANAVGLREPHKLLALIVLTYGVLLALGVDACLQRLRRQGSWMHVGGAVCLVSLPFLLTRVMLWGFDGQLQPRHYPADWATLKTELATKSEGEVLFLPWHQYMSFRFAGRIIANPAPAFFGSRIIVSQDPELDGAFGGPQDARQRTLSSLLAKDGDHRTLADTLAAHNISYVVVAKELDYASYGYLHSQPHLQLVRNSDTLLFYKNTAWRAHP